MSIFGVSWPQDLLGGIENQINEYLRFSDLNNIREILNPGDLLEFNRGLYSHYALSLGDGKVMNVCNEDINTRSTLIKEMRIEEMCDGSPVRIRKHDDVAQRYFHVQPKSTFEIIRDAKSFENQVHPYEFEFRNCFEYYSTLWRYGKGFSTQVANPITAPAGGLIGGILLGTTNLVANAAEVCVEGGIYHPYIELARK